MTGERTWTSDAVSDMRLRLWDAVIAIWTHTETHTTYVPGLGYRWQTGEPGCADPVEHTRLAAEEGAAWHEYSAYLRSVVRG